MDMTIFTVIENVPVADKTFRIVLSAGDPGFSNEAEFVNIALDGFYLRRPISVCESAPGRITLYYKTVGAGTEAMSRLVPGQTLDVMTGLGRGFDSSSSKKSALLVGGGLGVAPLLPLCKALWGEGKKVTVIMGFNKEDEIILADSFRSFGAQVYISTADGSVGTKGFVTDVINTLDLSRFDFFYTCGPLVMMKAVCTTLPLPGQASLEERMGCGAGYCYGCSINTAQGPRRVCKDGPVFNKEDIIW